MARIGLEGAVESVEMAIMRINNAAQAHVPTTHGAPETEEVSELRLLVRALADIRDHLRQLDAPVQAQLPHATPGGHTALRAVVSIHTRQRPQ